MAALLAVAPAASAATTRYSVANGCWSLRSADTGAVIPGAERVRLKATTLGSYMLYRPDRTFLAAQPGGAVGPDPEPSPAADWRVTEAGGGVFVLSPRSDAARSLRVRFASASGCAVFPEAALDYTGTPAKGVASYAAVRGFMEGHMHWTTYNYLGGNFFCGSPWHRYGIQYALPDCSSIEGPQGTAAPLQNTLNYGNPAQPHDTRGYPQLTSWDSTENLTYEGMYWRWVQRAWASGRAADGDEREREPRAVRAPGEPQVLLRRDDDRAARLPGRSASSSATSTRRRAARARASSRS